MELILEGSAALGTNGYRVEIERRDLLRIVEAWRELEGRAAGHSQAMTLRDASRARKLIWIFCLGCGHAARMDPYQLAMLLGHDIAIGAPVQRFRCQRCGRRQAATVLDPAPPQHDDRTNFKPPR